MNTEDSEFERIAREIKRQTVEKDNDTQVYKKPWVGLTDEEMTEIVTDIDVDWGDLLWKVVCLTKIIEAQLKERNNG